MKRRSFTILSALSLLLCVGVVVLWVRSIDYNHWMGFGGGRWSCAAESELGYVRFTYTRSYRKFDQTRGMYWGSARRSFRGAYFFRFTAYAGEIVPVGYPPDAGPYKYMVSVTIPHWCIAVLFLMWPLHRAWTWHRHRRRLSMAQCSACGYDLRATPGRCPECGATPVKAHA